MKKKDMLRELKKAKQEVLRYKRSTEEQRSETETVKKELKEATDALAKLQADLRDAESQTALAATVALRKLANTLNDVLRKHPELLNLAATTTKDPTQPRKTSPIVLTAQNEASEAAASQDSARPYKTPRRATSPQAPDQLKGLSTGHTPVTVKDSAGTVSTAESQSPIKTGKTKLGLRAEQDEEDMQEMQDEDDNQDDGDAQCEQSREVSKGKKGGANNETKRDMLGRLDRQGRHDRQRGQNDQNDQNDQDRHVRHVRHVRHDKQDGEKDQTGHHKQNNQGALRQPKANQTGELEVALFTTPTTASTRKIEKAPVPVSEAAPPKPRSANPAIFTPPNRILGSASTVKSQGETTRTTPYTPSTKDSRLMPMLPSYPQTSAGTYGLSPFSSSIKKGISITPATSSLFSHSSPPNMSGSDSDDDIIFIKSQPCPKLGSRLPAKRAKTRTPIKAEPAQRVSSSSRTTRTVMPTKRASVGELWPQSTKRPRHDFDDGAI